MSRLVFLLIVLGFSGPLAAAQAGSRPEFHMQRDAASDLEVSGLVRGIPAGQSRFVTREYLTGLPQIDVVIQQSEVIAGKPDAGVPVRGLYLDVLAKSLGADGEAAAGICTDGYTSTFPAEYIHVHRPILVLTIEGLAPHEWALKNGRFDAGPYFVGYQAFKPSFTVLSHMDRPAEPDGMTKIVFDTEERLYAGIVPKKAAAANDPAVSDGYRIARQNCYRCHNAGGNGGTKSGVTWTAMGELAKQRSKFFMNWIHDPQVFVTNSKMPPNKEYDQATLTALQRYFATFAEEGE